VGSYFEKRDAERGEREGGPCCTHHLRRHWNSSFTPYYTISMQAFSPDDDDDEETV